MYYRLTSVKGELIQVYHQDEKEHSKVLPDTICIVIGVNIQKNEDKDSDYSIRKQDYHLCLSKGSNITNVSIFLSNEKVKIEKASLWLRDTLTKEKGKDIREVIKDINECRNARKTSFRMLLAVKKEHIKGKMYIEILLQNGKKIKAKIPCCTKLVTFPVRLPIQK
jgi:hypothetical protein